MRILFRQSITVERLNRASGKETYASNGTITGGIYGIAPSDAMISTGNLAQSAVLLCDTSQDIKETDRITDPSGNVYIVQSIKNTTGMNAIAYKRCVIERMNS